MASRVVCLFVCSGMCINLIFSRALEPSQEALKMKNSFLWMLKTGSCLRLLRYSALRAREKSTHGILMLILDAIVMKASRIFTWMKFETRKMFSTKKGLWMSTAMNERLRRINRGNIRSATKEFSFIRGKKRKKCQECLKLGGNEQFLSFHFSSAKLVLVRWEAKHSCKKLCIHALERARGNRGEEGYGGDQ